MVNYLTNDELLEELNNLVPYQPENDVEIPDEDVDGITLEVAKRLREAERQNLGKALDSTFFG